MAWPRMPPCGQVSSANPACACTCYCLLVSYAITMFISVHNHEHKALEGKAQSAKEHWVLQANPLHVTMLLEELAICFYLSCKHLGHCCCRAVCCCHAVLCSTALCVVMLQGTVVKNNFR